jgi:hypothetical protein
MSTSDFPVVVPETVDSKPIVPETIVSHMAIRWRFVFAVVAAIIVALISVGLMVVTGFGLAGYFTSEETMCNVTNCVQYNSLKGEQVMFCKEFTLSTNRIIDDISFYFENKINKCEVNFEDSMCLNKPTVCYYGYEDSHLGLVRSGGSLFLWLLLITLVGGVMGTATLWKYASFHKNS